MRSREERLPQPAKMDVLRQGGSGRTVAMEVRLGGGTTIVDSPVGAAMSRRLMMRAIPILIAFPLLAISPGSALALEDKAGGTWTWGGFLSGFLTGSATGALITGVVNIYLANKARRFERQALQAGLQGEIKAGISRAYAIKGKQASDDDILFTVNHELPYEFYKGNLQNLGLIGPSASRIVVDYHTLLWAAYKIAEAPCNKEKAAKSITDKYIDKIIEKGELALQTLGGGYNDPPTRSSFSVSR
jgi:hypothetical protein